MYKNILVALENSHADEALIPHIAELAKIHGSHLLLVHVADGWVARNFNTLKLTESEEMKTDRNYLESVAGKLRRKDLDVSTHLALGDPPDEILKVAAKEKCDLIAMTAHGHRLIGDVFFGSTIRSVRHKTKIPILLVHTPR
ncbi:MAG: universal stress protein [Verrucomicrobiae bacterium]|nr:universal stress protein [Verrucomicrobiae bacterium]